MLSQLVLSLSLVLSTISITSAAPSCLVSNIASDQEVNGTVSIDTSPLTPFHSPKLSAVNASAWEYWYWDGVSSDGSSGVTIVFFRDASVTAVGLPILRVELDAVWSNGIRFNTDVPIDDSTVTVCGPHTTGSWTAEDSQFNFQTVGDGEVKIELQSEGIEGTISLLSDTPPLYPSGVTYPNPSASLELVPLLYWNEAIPGGHIEVDLVLNGTELSFSGLGGDDRNWGSYIWDFTADHWYWIRIATGPYTLIYWEFVSGIDEKTYTYVHLLENSIPIFKFSSTEATQTVATLTLLYNGTTHGSFADQSTGFAIDLKTLDDCSYHFEVEHVNIMFEAPASNDEYSRFVNTAKGGKVGGKQFTGSGASEQNKIVEIYPLSAI